MSITGISVDELAGTFKDAVYAEQLYKEKLLTDRYNGYSLEHVGFFKTMEALESLAPDYELSREIRVNYQDDLLVTLQLKDAQGAKSNSYKFIVRDDRIVLNEERGPGSISMGGSDVDFASSEGCKNFMRDLASQIHDNMPTIVPSRANDF